MDNRERNKRFLAVRGEVLKERTRIQRDTFSEIERLLKVSDQRITTLLATQPSDYQLWALPKLKLEIQRTLTSMGKDATTSMQDGANSSWQAGQMLIDEPLAAAGVPVTIHGVIQHIDMRQLVAMREFMTERIRDITLKSVNRVNSELGLVLTGAQSPGDAIGNISRLLGTTNRGRALTIVRTELGRAFSTAGQARQLQARHLVPGLKKQWRRSGKVHSRISHDAADGQIQEVDQPYNVGGYSLMFPRDPSAPASETINCGCESLPYVESWNMAHPGMQPFSSQELSRNIFKRNWQQALDGQSNVA